MRTAMSSPAPRGHAWTRPAAYAGALIGAALLGAAIAYVLRASALPGLELAAAGVGGLGLLALAVTRYEWAVALAFALSAIVLIEPAPVDAAFAVVMCVAR